MADKDNLKNYLYCSCCQKVDCFEDNSKSCLECKEKILADHDKQIRDEVIELLTEKYFDVVEGVLHDKDLKLELNQALTIYARIMNGCNQIAEQLKEK